MAEATPAATEDGCYSCALAVGADFVACIETCERGGRDLVCGKRSARSTRGLSLMQPQSLTFMQLFDSLQFHLAKLRQTLPRLVSSNYNARGSTIEPLYLRILQLDLQLALESGERSAGGRKKQLVIGGCYTAYT